MDQVDTILKDVSHINELIEKNLQIIQEMCKIKERDEPKDEKNVMETTKTFLDTLDESVKKIVLDFRDIYSVWMDKDSQLTTEKVPETPTSNVEQSECNHTDSPLINSNTDKAEDVNGILENNLPIEHSSIALVEAEKANDSSKNITASNRNDTPKKDCEESIPDKDSNKIHSRSSDKSDGDEHMEQKSFLKCVDIKKLVKPDVLPRLESNDDTILIISDSEDESVTKNNYKPKFDNNTRKISRILNLRIKKPNIKNLDVTGNLSRINTLSCSNLVVNSNIRKTYAKKPKPQKNVQLEKFTLEDKKLSYKAYVPLPRIPCEKLTELYSKKKEIDEIKSLVNLKNLKKQNYSRRTSGDSSDSQNSSNDVAKPKRKRLKKVSEKRSSSSSDSSGKSTIITETVDDSFSTDPVVVIQDDISTVMNGIGSSSHHSGSDTAASNPASEKDKDKQKKSNKKEKPTTTREEKKKSNWRNDNLLKEKFSESESEDELVTFKKSFGKLKESVKKKLFKKKNVLDSDSSESREGVKKTDKTQEKETSSSSESESESESDDSQQKNKRKVRRRIKRMKNTSSEDEEEKEKKSTRKTIRKVMKDDSLTESTKQAEKDEKDRKMRILERQKRYNQIFECDKPKHVALDKIILDFKEDTKEELLTVHKDLVKKLKPHQAEGIQFMWNACFESLERAKSTDGSGCILAHCMGLGKTLQVITLVHTLIKHEEVTGIKRVLIVCPVNTGLNWVDEFSKWLDNIEDDTEIEVHDLLSTKNVSERLHSAKTWFQNGGVMVIGYDMFRNLTNPNNKRLRKVERTTFQNTLVDPGSDLIVCDEGHLLKNEKTNLSIAMNRVKTTRRIILTGTPMQNNLKEYYCMVQFVKPNLLGTYREYLNRFVNPITNGQYTDSTPYDISIMKRRSHVLHKMLDGLVERKDYSVLMPYLPPKHEYVLFIKLTEVQVNLYQHYMNEYAKKPVIKQRVAYLFSDFQEFQRICTHPRVLLNKSLEEKKKERWNDDEDSEGSLRDFIDDDSESSSSTSSESSSGSNSNSSSGDGGKKNKSNKVQEKSTKRLTRNSAAAEGIDIEKEIVQSTENEENEWWRQYCNGEELDNIALSGKLHILFEIIQQCELIGDKVLVFSQSLYSLNIIEYFLSIIDEATQNSRNEQVCGFSGSWALGLDYFRIDGSSSCDNRAAWCKNFNNPNNTRARLFLISTKAGGLGINLIGANRVIIFDVSWNPSHDIQSIYRIYRFGQTKPCYIYRFVTWGTMEMKIYERQVTKQAISKRVIDEQQIDRHYNQNDLAELYKFDSQPEEQSTPLVPKDVLLAELIQKEKDYLYKYHEHQSLLENKEDEELNEDERKAAWEEYENEKTARVTYNYNTASGSINNLSMSNIRMAVYKIVKHDNPTWTDAQIQVCIPGVIQQLQEQLDAKNMTLFNRIQGELQSYEMFLKQQMAIFRQNQLAATAAVALSARRRNMPSSSKDVIEINEM